MFWDHVLSFTFFFHQLIFPECPITHSLSGSLPQVILYSMEASSSLGAPCSSKSHAYLSYVLCRLCLVTESCPTLCDPMDLVYGILQTRIVELVVSLLQGIFLTQGSNPGLPHCRWILYQLNHKESPRILEWVAYLLSRGTFQPSNQTGVSCIENGFFTN